MTGSLIDKSDLGQISVEKISIILLIIRRLDMVVPDANSLATICICLVLDHWGSMSRIEVVVRSSLRIWLPRRNFEACQIEISMTEPNSKLHFGHSLPLLRPEFGSSP